MKADMSDDEGDAGAAGETTFEREDNNTYHEPALAAQLAALHLRALVQQQPASVRCDASSVVNMRILT